MTVTQFDDAFRWSGHLQIGTEWAMEAELTCAGDLTREQRERLTRLGWELEPPREQDWTIASSGWAGRKDVDDVVALLVHTLVDVCDLDVTRPVAGVVVCYG